MLERPQEALSALIDPALDPLFQRPSRLGPDSAWYGHIPFANWIMRAVRPALFVELGTHSGISYAAFCDAVLACHLPTRCLAVDSWQGDAHAGFYGEEIFTEFSRFHDQRYGAFSRLLRCRFDEALSSVPDASIDLLHIDGRHLFSDISQDFNAWLPKLSPRGVVLLHDTNVRERDFGVWRFWDEQARLYPSFEFLHAHGLGVLAVGKQAPDAVLSLCGLASTQAAGLLRERFALAGERWEKEYALSLRDREITQLTAAGHDAAALRAHAATLDGELGTLQARLVQADVALRHGSVELGLARSALANANVARHTAVLQGDALVRLARNEAEATRRLSAERDAAQAECEAAMAGREAARAERDAAFAAREAARTAHEAALDASREASGKAIQAARDAILLELAARTGERDAARLAHARDLELLQNSFFWRLTAPLRAVLDALRPRALPSAALPASGLQADAMPPAVTHMIVSDKAELEYQPEPETHEPEPQPVPEPEPEQEQEPEAAPEPDTEAQPTVAGPPDLRAIHRVLFVIGEPGTPGATYRCIRNAEACRMAGYEAETVALFDVNPDNLARADLLVLWRATMSPHIETMIRLAHEAGTRVAFDVDDLMTRPELARIDIIDGIRTIGANEAETRVYFTAMLRTMMASDFCITTTEELATQLRLQRDTVHVLPNTFDEATHRRARYGTRLRLESGDDGLVRLGYAGGTRTHQKDFAQAAAALARVLEARPQARLVLFQEPDNQRSLLQMEEFPELAEFAGQIEWRNMVPLEALPGELARFDISLCPLEVGNPFCEAKSELKYFESALAGACTVASPTGPYRRAIREGITGFLATGPAQWEHILLRLIDEPGLRRQVARDAYHDALWRFGPWRQAGLAACLLGSLDAARHGDPVSSPAAARNVELGLRRGAYLGRSLPEIPQSELLFSHDQLGEAEVTVVMTSYNYERHILEALDSVRAQTLDVLDLAIVDDGSSDQSVPLVIEWAKRHRDRFNRIRILRTVRNAGLGGARNVVFDAAETPWLMALDSDNRLLPDACAALLDALAQVPQAAFAYPRIRQFGGSDIIMGEAPFEAARLQTGNYIDAMAMVAKWAWAAAGGYYVRRDAMGWEDFDLWLNLVELGQFGIAVPEIQAEYRVHQNSMVNAITEQSDNKRAMVDFIESRHPWLRLRTRSAKLRS